MQFSKFSYNSQKLKINEKMMSMPRDIWEKEMDTPLEEKNLE